jgi:hypothetical protein
MINSCLVICIYSHQPCHMMLIYAMKEAFNTTNKKLTHMCYQNQLDSIQASLHLTNDLLVRYDHFLLLFSVVKVRPLIFCFRHCQFQLIYTQHQ